jgi:hypothetical protein
MVKKLTQNVYSDKQYKLTEYPKFLYEVSLYKIWKDRAECVGSQFYVADIPLTIVKETISKKVEDYRLVKFITWLSAPLDYLMQNNFKLVTDESTRRTRKSRTKRN